MAIQFDRVCYSVYFGPLDCLDKKNDIPVVKCEKGEVGDILIKEKKHYFDFDYFTNQTDNREDDE